MYPEKCHKCFISLGNNFKPCWRQGDANDILFIGEAPGTVENRTKIPFTGESGLLLRKFIKGYHLERFSSITNIIRCQPPRNRDPLPVEINNCKQYLFDDIREVSPKLIILVGKVPLAFFLGKAIEYAKPYINKPIAMKNSVIFPIYHPSYILRESNEALYFESFNIISNIYHGFNPFYGIKNFKKK